MCLFSFPVNCCEGIVLECMIVEYSHSPTKQKGKDLQAEDLVRNEFRDVKWVIFEYNIIGVIKHGLCLNSFILVVKSI